MDGSRTDGRQVGPAVLARFNPLQQNSARARARECCGPHQHGISALNRFHGKNDALLNDAALTNISSAKRSGNADRTFYVSLGSGIRCDLSKNSVGSKCFRQDFVSA